MATNGKLLINILSYNKLSFINKNNKSFYSRVLLKDEKSKIFTLMNSIPFNYESFEKVIGNANFENRIVASLERNSVDLVGYGRQISSALKVIEESTKMHQIWSRDDGLNMAILS